MKKIKITEKNYHPIGSFFISENSESPASLFGGSWEKIKDRFLLGAGDNFSLGNTGGENEHVLTIEEMPIHSHKTWSSQSGYSGNVIGPAQSPAKGIGSTEQNATYTENYWQLGETGRWVIGLEGGSQSHNNMPPYLVVNIWKRTA